MNMNLQELGQRIRDGREKYGLRQNDVAGALQVSPQAVSKWERGENAPDISLLAPLAALLGVSVDWLLTGLAQDRDVFDATVLVSGVQNAREMSAAMKPREFAAWTNSVCFAITEAVLQHDGIPIKYGGPGILSFFSGTDYRVPALRGAISARTTVGDIPIKIGLCAGRIYLGRIGHSDYAQSDVMGEAVSIARLAAGWAAANTAAGIAASVSAVEGLADAFKLGTVQQARFSGIDEDVSILEVIGEV